MYFEEILKKISEPVDFAVFFLSFAAGFLIDVLWFSGGIPAGTAAGVFAVGALGIKKVFDVAVVGSNRDSRKRIKERLRILRHYFSDNPKAYQVIDRLGEILDASLIDYDSFNSLLDAKLQNYIDEELKSIGSFDAEGKYHSLYEKYTYLYREFREFHLLCESPEINAEEIKKGWLALDENYFHVQQERRNQEIRRRREELEKMNREEI